MLDLDYIVANSNSHKFKLEILPTVDSTNEYLRKLPAEELPRVCLAEQQTKGRGRLGRSWHSPRGQNIYLSCSYSLEKRLAGLSLVIGLAVVSALKKYLPPEQLKVKWPNDVMFESDKLAGILIDIEGGSRAIIGVGINVNMVTAEEQQISQPWTSMAKILGHKVDRNELVVFLLNTVFGYLERFIESGFNDFLKEWGLVDYLLGRDITVEMEKKGKAQGVDQQARLLLELPSGVVEPISAGEIVIQL